MRIFLLTILISLPTLLANPIEQSAKALACSTVDQEISLLESAIRLLTFGVLVFENDETAEATIRTQGEIKEEDLMNNVNSSPVQGVSEWDSEAILEPYSTHGTIGISSDGKSVVQVTENSAHVMSQERGTSNEVGINFVPNATSAVNRFVAPELDSSSVPYTFRGLRSEVPCTSSAQASFERSLMKENLKPFVVEEETSKVKKVSFEFPESQESEAIASYRAIRRAQKEASLDTVNKQKLEEYSRKLKSILRSMIQSIDEISEEGTEVQKAAIYADTYPKARESVQGMLLLIENDHELQNTKNVAYLTKGAVKVIEIASKAIALEDLEPIKAHLQIRSGIKKPFHFPFTDIDLNQYVDAINIESEIIAREAEEMLRDLIGIRQVLQLKDIEIGSSLLQWQWKRAFGVSSIADIQSEVCTIKIIVLSNNHADPEELQQCKLEHNKLVELCKKNTDVLRVLQHSSPITDPVVARNTTVDEALKVTELSLEAADKMKSMLLARKISRP